MCLCDTAINGAIISRGRQIRAGKMHKIVGFSMIRQQAAGLKTSSLTILGIISTEGLLKSIIFLSLTWGVVEEVLHFLT